MQLLCNFFIKNTFASCYLGTVDEKQTLYLVIFPIQSTLFLFCFQVIRSSSTLDGAVAQCILKFGDKEGKQFVFYKDIISFQT